MSVAPSWRGTVATATAVTASTFALTGTADAAACVANSTGAYFVSGFSCTAGEVTFSNFSYDPGDFTGFLLRDFFRMAPNGSGLDIGITYCVNAAATHSISFTVAAAAGREIVGMDSTGIFQPIFQNAAQVGSFRAEGSNGAVADATVTIPPNGPPNAATPTDSASFAGVDSLSVTITMYTERLGARGGAIGFTLADKAAVTPVPEPASLALFGIGLTGLAALRARRLKRAGKSVH